MILNINNISDVRSRIKSENKKLVFTNGCFDIIHKGHVSYLNQAKLMGDYLIVGLNSDKSVKKLKGDDRPVNNENDRAFILDNLKSVDFVIIFNEDTPYELIKLIVPDYLVKGGDWRKIDIVGSDIVTAAGGKVLSLNFINNYSSTGIIEKIRKH
ncbi:MAG TPA: D-glycero-beta-D-manno-heptose 1-phosphate adenylyltransferase [Ignavibacteria bacterium]|nr:D-glycero-beta-D-manno-heptose 1-phosphate adenylyltransferase [Ignavibacteria bacterium]HQY50857.1 D-glycero-beta-D-manno-heptose 1-phosphate adenylyltransferase [Ignavibacteria bacterium]HRA98938.1 D-glycero-beta-D-manno-heptose 1-phosphate adenylyltransferase [Ignavibacteria bacterium]